MVVEIVSLMACCKNFLIKARRPAISLLIYHIQPSHVQFVGHKIFTCFTNTIFLFEVSMRCVSNRLRLMINKNWKLEFTVLRVDLIFNSKLRNWPRKYLIEKRGKRGVSLFWWSIPHLWKTYIGSAHIIGWLRVIFLVFQQWIWWIVSLRKRRKFYFQLGQLLEVFFIEKFQERSW